MSPGLMPDRRTKACPALGGDTSVAAPSVQFVLFLVIDLVLLAAATAEKMGRKRTTKEKEQDSPLQLVECDAEVAGQAAVALDVVVLEAGEIFERDDFLARLAGGDLLLCVVEQAGQVIAEGE